jgi:DNA polymerase-4
MLVAAAAAEIEGRGLTLVGVAVANLESDAALQLTLPLTERSADQLDTALDAVRNRFGSTAITRAVLLGRDPGLTMPHLPD